MQHILTTFLRIPRLRIAAVLPWAMAPDVSHPTTGETGANLSLDGWHPWNCHLALILECGGSWDCHLGLLICFRDMPGGGRPPVWTLSAVGCVLRHYCPAEVGAVGYFNQFLAFSQQLPTSEEGVFSSLDRGRRGWVRRNGI